MTTPLSTKVFALVNTCFDITAQYDEAELADFQDRLNGLLGDARKPDMPMFYVVNTDAHDEVVFRSMLRKMQRDIRPGGIVRLNDEEYALFQDMAVCPLHIHSFS